MAKVFAGRNVVDSSQVKPGSQVNIQMTPELEDLVDSLQAYPAEIMVMIDQLCSVGLELRLRYTDRYSCYEAKVLDPEKDWKKRITYGVGGSDPVETLCKLLAWLKTASAETRW